jgi:putative peptide zinc metalloprotease protein
VVAPRQQLAARADVAHFGLKLSCSTQAMEPLLSPDWYRVSALQPRLRHGVGVSRQVERGEVWYVLSDPVSGKHHRFNDIAFGLISACDGERTLDQVWAHCAEHSSSAPTQGEALRVFSLAFAANLLIANVSPDAAALVRSQSKQQRQRARSAVNPLSFRVPLWNPDAYLNRHAARLRFLFSGAAGGVVIALAVLGAVLLAFNAASVASQAQNKLGSGAMLLALWLAYPLVKGLHELAHAFAVKAYGGEVHEMGVTLLMLTPVPYVDASASIAFSDKKQRMVVAAAGIVVELVLATLALLLWLNLEAGGVKDVALAVVLIGGLSTLLVNGNPLLRFDGYHVLCDFLELPHWAQRSQALWRFLAKRWVLRLTATAPFEGDAPGARPWLLAYAPLAWAYRVLLLAWLALWLASVHPVLGLMAVAWAVWSLGVQAIFQTLRFVLRAPELQGQRAKAVGLTALGSAALMLLVFAVPLPYRTQAPGVVWLSDEAMVRLGTDGFVEEYFALDGERVVAGQALLRLSNDVLQADAQRAQAALARLEVERAASFDLDAVRAGVANDALARAQAEADRLQERVNQLVVRAATTGRVVISPGTSVVGQYLPQGQLVAHVLSAEAALVKVMVRNEDIEQVRLVSSSTEAAVASAQRISVELAHAPGADWAARWVASVPQASSHLPSAALGESAGGSIALDGSDKTGRTAREPRFQLDLRLPANSSARIGERCQVTFLHDDASAAQMLAQFARRSFLRHFEG